MGGNLSAQPPTCRFASDEAGEILGDVGEALAFHLRHRLVVVLLLDVPLGFRGESTPHVIDERFVGEPLPALEILDQLLIVIRETGDVASDRGANGPILASDDGNHRTLRRHLGPKLLGSEVIGQGVADEASDGLDLILPDLGGVEDRLAGFRGPLASVAHGQREGDRIVGSDRGKLDAGHNLRRCAVTRWGGLRTVRRGRRALGTRLAGGLGLRLVGDDRRRGLEVGRGELKEDNVLDCFVGHGGFPFGYRLRGSH
jgi:hypothetical protein